MADSFGKKEREKKKAKRKKEKEQRKEERRSQGKQTEIFMYVDEFGNFTETKPERTEVSLDDIPEQGVKIETEPSKHEGRVKFVDSEKGFGFIQAGGKLGDIYFNMDGLDKEPSAGQKVAFNTEDTPKGPRAIDIELV